MTNFIKYPCIIQFFSDMCYSQAARAAGETGRICAELVFGFKSQAAQGLDEFHQLRRKIDESQAGARLAKDRAGKALTQVMIPEALDYPAL